MQICTEKEAEDFLEKNGFPVAERTFVRSEEDALEAAHKIGFPLALKIVSDEILHKSDVGGVKLDLRNDKDVKDAFYEIEKIKGFQGALVQKYREGIFLILGIKKDKNFGHVIGIGSGGIYTEILKDISFRVCPITNKDADEMIKEIKSYSILKGARGSKPIDFELLKKILVDLSHLPFKHKNISELDINPLIVNEKEIKIVDARIIFD